MATSEPRNKPLRVFIDSSVLIAAAISATGAARELVRHVLEGALEVFVSNFVLQETARNLHRKAPAALPLFTHSFQPALLSQVVDPPESSVRRVAQVIEPKDAPIVAAALAANADYLLSFDRKHLLNQATQIHNSFDLVVTTPDQIIHL